MSLQLAGADQICMMPCGEVDHIQAQKLEMSDLLEVGTEVQMP